MPEYLAARGGSKVKFLWRCETFVCYLIVAVWKVNAPVKLACPTWTAFWRPVRNRMCTKVDGDKAFERRNLNYGTDNVAA